MWHPTHCTSTSFNKSNTAFGAGLISVGTKELSSEQQGHTGVDAATRSATQLVQPADDMAVQGAVWEYLNTSTPSGQWHCFGLPVVGMAHLRRLEEGQSSKDGQLTCSV